MLILQFTEQMYLTSYMMCTFILIWRANIQICTMNLKLLSSRNSNSIIFYKGSQPEPYLSCETSDTPSSIHLTDSNCIILLRIICKSIHVFGCSKYIILSRNEYIVMFHFRHSNKIMNSVFWLLDGTMNIKYFHLTVQAC